MDRGRGTGRLRRGDRRADRRRPAIAHRSWQGADRDGGGRAGGDVAGAADPELGAGVRGFGTGAARAFGARGPGHAVHAAGAGGVLVPEPRGAGFRAAVGVGVVLVELGFAVGFSVAVCVPFAVGLAFAFAFAFVVAVVFAFAVHVAFVVTFDVTVVFGFYVTVVFGFYVAFDVAFHVDVDVDVDVDVCFGFRGRGAEFGLIRY